MNSVGYNQSNGSEGNGPSHFFVPKKMVFAGATTQSEILSFAG